MRPGRPILWFERSYGSLVSKIRVRLKFALLAAAAIRLQPLERRPYSFATLPPSPAFEIIHW